KPTLWSVLGGALWRGFKVKRQLALDVDRWHPAFRVRRLSTFDERQELIGARVEVTVQVLFVLHVRRAFLCCLTLDLSRAAKRRRLEGLVRLLSAHHAAAYVR